uniref:G_PROTEIN_RECEP_F1_2 domain-containing protein n=1 Tax=Angiostrongylus costaricensis TaxID=334426 RepID=A0A0R3PS82_ANGCS
LIQILSDWNQEQKKLSELSFLTTYFSFGSVISVVGCACNLLLLFVFLSRSSSNPFQTFLAFLDFMLCFLFITCFGVLTFSVTFRIAMKTYNVHMLIASRMVQLCIPYILIANTAFRLFLHLFVSFVILCVLNCIVVNKLRSSHRRARRQSACPAILHTVKMFNTHLTQVGRFSGKKKAQTRSTRT